MKYDVKTIEKMDNKYKPEFILPFSITQEEAENRIRKRLKKSFFIPGKFKCFKATRIRGIYVPFWIYDIFYRDSQLIHVSMKKSRSVYTYDKRVKARVEFKGVTVNGSEKFSNELSQKLEPYDLSALTEFYEEDLSGFYMESYDQSAKEMEGKAVERCKELFDREVKRSITADKLSVKESNPNWKVRKKVYALLPVWFLTICYKDKNYTMMVNGQTGKVVGAVPFVKWKVVAVFLTLWAIFMQFIPKLCTRVFADEGVMVIGWLILTVIIYIVGIGFYQELKEDMSNASAKGFNEYIEGSLEEAWKSGK